MGEDSVDASVKKKSHRERNAGRKAEKKKAKKDNPNQELSDKQRNPKAFAFNSAVRAERKFRRKQDIETKKQHVPLVDRTPIEPPPILIAVVGPPKVGKSTVINNLIKLFTKSPLTDIKGPVTIVTGKKRRITLIECNNDINSMIDIAKVADLVLLLCDASFGFEMEIFEFLNICQVLGMPRIMGILTHLDMIKNNKTLKNTKKLLKHRFWTEVYAGAKLFYLSGIVHGEYLRNEIKNLGRFISVIKFRPLTWRSTHSYLLGDRIEDLTNQEFIRQNSKCDRTVSLYGYVRGVPLVKNTSVHIAGLGDLKIADISYLPDPCPLPEAIKKRALVEKERLIYAPFSGVGGIVYDKDAVYVELGGSHSHKREMDESQNLMSNLIDTKETLDVKMQHSEMQIFTGGKKLTAKDFKINKINEKAVINTNIKESVDSDLDEEINQLKTYNVEQIEDNGRTRRKVIFDQNDDEFSQMLMKTEDSDESHSDESDETDKIQSEYTVLKENKDQNIHDVVSGALQYLNKKKSGEMLDSESDHSDSSDESVISRESLVGVSGMKKKKDNILKKSVSDESDSDESEIDFSEIAKKSERSKKLKNSKSEDSDESEFESESDEHEIGFDKIKNSDLSKSKKFKKSKLQDTDESESDDDIDFTLKKSDHSKLKKSKSENSDETKLKISKKSKPEKTDKSDLKSDSDVKKKVVKTSVSNKSDKFTKMAESDESGSESESDSDADITEKFSKNIVKKSKTMSDSNKSESDSESDSDAEINEKILQKNLSGKQKKSNTSDLASDVDNATLISQNKLLESEKADTSDSDEDLGLKWKENLAKKARDAFLDHQKTTQNIMKLVYSVFDKHGFKIEEEDKDREEIGGLFHLVTHEQKRLKEEKEKLNIVESSLFNTWDLTTRNWLDDENKVLIQNCFVTGKWKDSEDAQELLRLDDMDVSDEEIFGDFEDLETGEKHTAKNNETTKPNLKRQREDTETNENELDKEALKEKKRKLKEKFDNEYDNGEKSTYYDDLKTSAEKQAQLNKSVFENMADDLRVQIEGYRAGMYVRIEFENVPSEFITNFDPTYPLVIGALNMGEENIGYVNVKIKKHRWYKKILKTSDPLIISLGWRRFQTIPLYSKLEDDLKYRYLKYTPEHVQCNAHFWGPITPQGTGLLAVQSCNNDLDTVKKQGFRIAATGSVQELDKSTQIMKKLKLIGYPLKIYKKTAFIKDMFNSALEVAKFEGARIKTVSGIRGQIKKAANKPEGAFRATFEDKIQLSDIVFCRTWYRVDVPHFYAPVNTLLLPPEKKNAWKGARTTGQIKKDMGVRNDVNNDSLYTPIERQPKVFKPLFLPRKLQKELPYRDRPKYGPLKCDRKPNIEKKRVAVIREPHEQNVANMLKMLRTSYEQKQENLKSQMSERMARHKALMEGEEVRKLQKQKAKKKEVFRAKSKAKIREEKKGRKK